jgi:hypothetical protein
VQKTLMKNEQGLPATRQKQTPVALTNGVQICHRPGQKSGARAHLARLLAAPIYFSW